MQKEIIGVDLDNIIAATDIKIRSLIQDLFGISSTKDQISCWNYSESLGISLEDEILIFDLFHKNHLLSLGIVKGAKSSLVTLSQKYSIWILTSRPPFTQEKTIEWLRTKSIPFERLIFTNHKIEYAKHLSFLVEDKLDTVLDFSRIYRKTFLLDYPWNQGKINSYITRVHNWQQIVLKANIFAKN